MRLRRFIAALIAVVMCVALFAACGDGKKAETTLGTDRGHGSR